MKRIAAIILLAGLGTGCTTTQSLKSTTSAADATIAAKSNSTTGKSGVVQASASTVDSGVQQAAGFARVTGGGCDTGCDTGGIKGRHWGGIGLNRGCNDGSCGSHGGHGHGGFGGHGIMAAMPMGPAGAVAAIGAIGPGMGMPIASNMRTAIRFLGNGKVTWYAGGSYADPGMTMPADYNFAQGNIYRLKISGIPNRPGKVYYPTLEVAPATMKSLTFLDHGNVPVSFTDDDLQRVDSGNLVVKVIYLPDSLYQDVTVSSGIEEIISTQLEPGADPVVEAHRRGTILAIIRLGNINLENPNSPAKDAPPAQMTPNMAPAAPPSAMPMGNGPVSMAPAAMPSLGLSGTMLK